MADEKVPLAATPVYEVLSEAQVQKIVDAIFRLLRETGVAFEPDPRVLDLFSDAGCDISADHVVRFETDFVKQCLESLAKTTKIWNRDGTDFHEMKEGNTVFRTSMTCIRVFDLETGERRDSTFDDLATITRVADALPNVDGVCLMVKDVPNSTLHGEIGEFVAMAENTTKPLEYLCEKSAAFDAAIEMAAAIRGGMDRLAEKPYFVHTVTPLPLYYAQTHTDQIIRAAECHIPITTGTDCIGGAATPYTVAGSMTHALATDFAGVALSQLVQKGAFCAPCSDNIFMEPLRGSLGTEIPGLMADLATRQVMTHLGLLPMAGSGGGSRARRFNQDAAFQIAAGFQKMFFTRPAVTNGMGSIDSGLTYSLHALLLNNDLAGMLRCLWNGVTVDDEHLALELTHSVGPKGNYLAQPHTAKHCQDNYWDSRYFGARFPRSNSPAIPDRELIERIDEDVRSILATQRPEPLAEPVRKEIRAILARFEDA
jgi:trimethylamine:corrinoid methyltransferase-like protein